MSSKRSAFLSLLLTFMFIPLLEIYQVQAQDPSTSTHPHPPKSPRIVGGEEAIPGAWPYQVALIARNGPIYFTLSSVAVPSLMNIGF